MAMARRDTSPASAFVGAACPRSLGPTARQRSSYAAHRASSCCCALPRDAAETAAAVRRMNFGISDRFERVERSERSVGLVEDG